MNINEFNAIVSELGLSDLEKWFLLARYCMVINAAPVTVLPDVSVCSDIEDC